MDLQETKTRELAQTREPTENARPFEVREGFIIYHESSFSPLPVIDPISETFDEILENSTPDGWLDLLRFGLHRLLRLDVGRMLGRRIG